jgi:hypothetical protein
MFTNFLVLCDFCLIFLIFVGGLTLKHKIDQIEEKSAMPVVVLDREAYLKELAARGFHKNDSRLALENVADGLSQRGYLVIDSRSVISSPRQISGYDISKELLDEVRLLAKDRENGSPAANRDIAQNVNQDVNQNASQNANQSDQGIHQNKTVELPHSDVPLDAKSKRDILSRLTSSFFDAVKNKENKENKDGKDVKEGNK